MSDFKAWFNGHDLSTLFVISPPERNLVTWEPTMADAVIGAVPTGTKAQPMEITLQLTTFAATLEQRLADLRTLSGWLAVDEPKRLYLSDEMIGSDCLYRDAMPKDAPKVTYALNAATAEVKFVCPDPRAYLGDYPPSQYPTTIERTHHFSPDSPFDGTAGGTAPTNTIIRATGVTGDSDNEFQIKVTCYDSGNHVLSDCGGTITIPAQSRFMLLYVIFDSEGRTYTRRSQSGTTQPPLPPDSDWIRISGGHRMTVEVTKGNCSSDTQISYTPRWW